MNSKLLRVFKINEQIKIIAKAAKGFVLLRSSRKTKLMNKKLKERIMLAITEVNGCELCSYIHTSIALKSGMTREQIKLILGGDTSNIPIEDAVAVMFGQEYAYSKENPSINSIDRLINDYGIQKANLVMAACHMITMTNGMGISMHLFLNRIKFKADKRSNIMLEIMIPLFTMILFPPLVIYNMLKTLFTTNKKINLIYN